MENEIRRDDELQEEIQEETVYFLARDMVNKPVISVRDGRQIGKVQDFFISHDARQVTAIHLGSEGLLSRKSFLIRTHDVVVMGPDATIVKDTDVVVQQSEEPETEHWLRRDDFKGRSLTTAGGTKVGKIGDIIVDGHGQVRGFSLGSVDVSGPIAENRAIALHAVQNIEGEDGDIIVDLQEAERQELRVVS